jgi:hypothetical protein
MFGIGDSTKSIEAIEREIADLEIRKAQLGKLQTQAVADEAAAEARLEKFLATGDLSDGLNGAQTAVHIAKQNVIDLGRAVERQTGLIAVAQERLAQACDLEAREKAAVGREQVADLVEAAADKLQDAIKAVAQAFDRLAAAVPEGLVDIKVWNTWMTGASQRPLSAIEIARAILAEALYQTAPESFEVVARDSDILIEMPVLTRRAGRVARGIRSDDPDFLDAIGSARALVGDPLRQSAADIRTGVVLRDQPASLALPPAPPPIAVVNMLLLQPVIWKDREGRIVRHDAWTIADLPVTIGKRAVERGVGVGAGTSEAQAHIHERQNQIGGLPWSAPTPVDLGSVT